jgi:hypothetical protein
VIGVIPVQGYPGVPLINAGDQPSLIVNLDLNNTVYLTDKYGDQPSVQQKAVPLPPGGATLLTGKITVYGSCQGTQTATIGVIEGALNFFNSVFNALTGKLIATAVKSPNFVHQISGWSINKDGSAEFNNLITRNGEIISGKFLLYSSAIPAKGNLVLSIAGVSGTDEVGNNYGQGLNIGMWSGVTGNQLQHFGVDDNGRVYIVGPDNIIRIQINNGTSGVGPDIRFYNDFGAVILVVDPNAGGVFQYQDNGSAVQGVLIGGFISKNATDPVDGTAINAGINVIDPVFGDSINVVGANVNFNQATFTRPGIQTANTGAGATRPFMVTVAPEQGHAGHCQQRWYGTSVDGTVLGGSVISLTDPPVPATTALLEVQGDLSHAALSPMTFTNFSNSAAETVIASATIPANDGIFASTYDLIFHGSVAVALATSLDIRARVTGLGGVLLLDFGAINCLVAAGNRDFWVDAQLIFRGTGNTNVDVKGILTEIFQNGVAPPLQHIAFSGFDAINNTATVAITITAQFSAANAGNSISSINGSLNRRCH